MRPHSSDPLAPLPQPPTATAIRSPSTKSMIGRPVFVEVTAQVSVCQFGQPASVGMSCLRCAVNFA